eukprot:TRINITY_DN57266_c0_g1_i1.p1 TRINITY_DN57266_c0_g1~~TRINITY_DN57266_c0_g1_i1.p1  ORF type:complete len:173 (-),score=33.05 TRINITY_DN57266_c0_g1_i1:23-541(-)
MASTQACLRVFALCVLRLLIRTAAYPTFWPLRKGCVAPKAGMQVMGNPLELATLTDELTLQTGDDGKYVPGKLYELDIKSGELEEHLVYVSGGKLSNSKFLHCDDSIAAFGEDKSHLSISWKAPEAGSGPVVLSLLAAPDYGPVTLYELKLEEAGLSLLDETVDLVRLARDL